MLASYSNMSHIRKGINYSIQKSLFPIIVNHLLFRKQRRESLGEKNSIRTKSLAIVYFYDITVQQYHKASPGKNQLLGFAVPRCASHCFAFYHRIYSEYQRNVTISASTLDTRCLRTSRNQKTNWIG